MAHCKSCGAEIIWIETAGGKKMPCDPEPVLYEAYREGPLTIVTRNGEVFRAKNPVDVQNATGVGFISHFATCPNADQHRKRGKE